jgi:steroid delta-isomerase-like uncharacterized protein
MTAVVTDVLTVEQMIRIAREQIEAFRSSDWERMQAGLATDASYHELATQRKVEGSERILELNKGWKTAFPDGTGTVTSAIAGGNMSALEVTWRGTHTGPLVTAEGTIPSSGKHQETPAVCVFSFEDGKINESRMYFDALTLLRQIGAQPE